MPYTARADIVEFPVYRFYGSAKQERLPLRRHDYDDMRDYWLEGRAYEHAYAWNKLYRRRLFDGMRFPDGLVFEDVHTLPRLLADCQRVTTIDRGLYYYCLNTQGITVTATGRELGMLLDAHLAVLSQWCDDRYYLHVLNIQMDVYERTGAAPLLPRRHISLLSKELSAKERMKGLTVNLLGIRNICKINKTLHRWMGRRS